jgi:D-3-phosphoglycerate dehydrogenase / 2-oxoglutarate reductase
VSAFGRRMNVLIADQFEQSGIDAIVASGCDVLYEPSLADQQLADALTTRRPDVLILRSTRVTEPMLADTSLSLIVRAGAGVNTIDVDAASRRGIYVSNCPGKNSHAVAELTFALILALDRRIAENVSDLRAGKWNKKEYSKARGLFGRTLGILGYGNIGQEVARRALAFGMHVVVWSRRFDRGSGIRDQGSGSGDQRSTALDSRPSIPDPLITVLPSPQDVAGQSDVLSVHLALASDTRDFVNGSVFDRLEPGSYFVNTSRAEVVDHAALAAAVRTRGIRVALDVFAKEPLSGSGEFTDPLLTLPGVIGTHHIGASTEQAQEAIAAEAARIVRVYKETGHVPNVVNLASTTPATHRLVVRHRDRPGVLAHVFDHLRAGNLNVQETENIVFEGAEAAIARINLDGEPPAKLLETIARGNQDILNLYLVKI